MADTTPISNQLNINLSIRMDDAVSGGADNGATAALDGAVMSSARRNYYINSGCRNLVRSIVENIGQLNSYDILQGAIKTQSITFSSSGTTLNKDFMYPARLVSSSANYTLAGRPELTIDFNPMITNGYAIDAGKIYGYTRDSNGLFAILSSGTATFYYYSAQRVDTSTGAETAVNTAPDIAVDSRWWDVILLFAQAEACNDKSIIENEPSWAEQGGKFFAQAMSRIPKKPE